MSAVIAAAMTEKDAERLTERIRLTAHNYAEARQKLQELVAEAKAGNAHIALGYASWTAYLSEVLGEEPLLLARGERQEMVQMLSAEGMSMRAIAPIVGTSHITVRNDLTAVKNLTAEPLRADILGMDGKHHPRTKPRPAVGAVPEPSPDLDIINDIRLYLRHLSTSPKIAALPPAGKQHIIDALSNAIKQLEEN